MKDIFILLFCLITIGLTAIAVYLAVYKTGIKKLKGKYIIVHYIDCGDLNDELSEDRIKQLSSSSDFFGKNFGLDLTPLEIHVMKYKANHALKNKYNDVAEELFIPVQRGQHTHIEILDFNKSKSFIRFKN